MQLFKNILRHILGLLILVYADCTAENKYPIKISLSEWVVDIDPYGLKLNARKNCSSDYMILSAYDKIFAKPSNISFNDDFCNIEYTDSKLKVSLFKSHSRLHCKIIFTGLDQVLRWPTILFNEQLQAYLLPEGEGLYIPAKDNRITSILDETSLPMGQATLPFLGLQYKNYSCTVIIHSYLRSRIDFLSTSCGALEPTLSYDFRTRDKQNCYELSFYFTGPDILSSAKVFKSYLKEQGNYVTLKEKAKSTPEIEKLAGAIHSYAWGSGRTSACLDLLKKIGLTNLLILYEEKPHRVSNDEWEKTDYVDQKFIELAKQYGYLVGPYDSWHTAQSLDDADCHNTDFGQAFFDSMCVYLPNGQMMSGYAGRGGYISMKAEDAAGNIHFYDRFKVFRAHGINSYFLDCHATGEVFDDYSADHPQTAFDDLSIRIKHLDYLSKKNVVLGSETAAFWAVPFLAYAHGNFNTLYSLHWPVASNNKIYGGWGPARKPGKFFKQIEANDLYRIRYMPQYRVPLWQAVFHESCVTSDRWETPLTKFSNLYEVRFLLELLYGVPSMWSLDIETVKKYSSILHQQTEIFTPYHKQVFHEELSKFEYLTEDRLVQRVTWGNSMQVTANFKSEKFNDLPAQTLKILSLVNGSVKVIKPESLNAQSIYKKDQTCVSNKLTYSISQN